MRRLVGIHVRSAVAVTLPLAGAIYLAAEARQVAIRRYSEALSLQPGSTQSAIVATRKSDDPIIAPSDLRVTSALAQETKPDSRDNELAAEQQAAQIPAQPSPKKTAKNRHTRQIVVSIPDRRMALLEDGRLLKVYPVAVGASETPSPEGEFTIINHAVDPTYRHEGKEIGPGKNNPLGTRWMGLSLKGYGIHGTNRQRSVGRAASHGCFRMKKKDVEELYSRVQVGDAVSIHGQRDELTASLFTSGANADPVVATNKPETEIASATTAGATADEDK